MSSIPAPLQPPAAAPTWFGHPRGLAVLFLTETWERMSYYGMRSLLVLYMVNHLFVRPDVGAEVLGFNALKSALEHTFGVLTPQALSSQVYGLYTGFVYLTPLFGGMLADRWLGQRRAVVMGAVLMSIGHFLMASERLFFLALMVLVVGNGCFKPNTSSQVGALYPPGDPRRDRAYSIFYMGVNLGAALAPLVCGTLGQLVGWHWGFGAAGVGMVLGLLIYVLNQRHLAPEPPLPPPRTRATSVVVYLLAVPLGIVLMLWMLTLPLWVPLVLALAVLAWAVRWIATLPADERPRVASLALACSLTAAFWAIYEQQGNTLQLWADENTRWPTLLGFTIPSTWYQSFNPVAIWLLVPLLNALWARQALRGREPGSLTKMALGCTITGLGFIVMVAAATGMQAKDQHSVLWLVAATAIFTVGELYLSPVGLSYVTKVAPLRMVSMLMGVWYLSSFFGNYLTGWLGSFWERMPRTSFFWMMTAIGVTAGALLWLLSRRFGRGLETH